MRRNNSLYPNGWEVLAGDVDTPRTTRLTRLEREQSSTIAMTRWREQTKVSVLLSLKPGFHIMAMILVRHKVEGGFE